MPILLVGVISISFEESKVAVKKDSTVRRLSLKVINAAKAWHPGVDLDERAQVLKEVFDELDCD